MATASSVFGRFAGLHRLRRAPLWIALLLAGALAPQASRAQIGLDDVPRSRTIPDEEEVRNDMERSRLRLGPLRILPAIFVTNAGYDSNVFSSTQDPVSDWTATVSAGARLLVSLGPRMYLRADAFPHYTWYEQLVDRRRFGGVYEGSLFGFFNRMRFRLGAHDREDYVIYSSELSSRVLEKLRGASAGLELNVTRSVALFGSGDFQRVRYEQIGGPPSQDSQVRSNGRDDAAVRGGVRYKISADWDVAALVEGTRSEFELVPEQRDNRSIAYLGGIYFHLPKLFANVSGGYRQGRPSSGSLFPEYETPTGSFFVSYFAIRWLELQGYGRRRVYYSVTATDPYYIEGRLGGGVNIELFGHVLLRGFGEAGPNTYPVTQIVEGASLKRLDHTRTYGGGLSIKLPVNAVLTGLVSRQVYDSNFPGQSRDFTRFTAFLNFNGEYTR